MSQSDLSTILYRAEQACQEGRWDDARQLYQQTLEIQPDHPEAQRQLGRLDRREVADEAVRELIQEADACLEAGKFKEARGIYVQAMAQAAHAGILQYSAALEQKRNETAELAAWAERFIAALGEAKQIGKQQDCSAAREPLARLLQELPKGPFYDNIAGKLRQELQAIEGRIDADKLYQQALEAFNEQDFEQSIRLAEAIPPESPRHAEAQRHLDRVHGVLKTYVEEPMARVEQAFQEKRWDDAFVELDNLRNQFPQSPLWRRLWLQVGRAHGQQELDRGRQANGQRDFEAARRHFQNARVAFEKVLEVYPTHTTVQALRDEAVDLREVAVQETQAWTDWQAGRRQDALAALNQAQRRVEHARAEGRDYATVAAVVDVMCQRLSDETDRIKKEAQGLEDGERLFKVAG